MDILQCNVFYKYNSEVRTTRTTRKRKRKRGAAAAAAVLAMT